MKAKPNYLFLEPLKGIKSKKWLLMGVHFSRKKVEKYLGVHIDCNLYFDEEIKKMY